MASHSNTEVCSPVVSDVEESSQREAELEKSDVHKNKDFQLIYVPEGSVSIWQMGGGGGWEYSVSAHN